MVGRYAVYGEIAKGGMATVHFGRLLGPVGFSRTVAIKRLHPQYAGDQEFVSMFIDEAKLAARIQNPHVVSTVDVVAMDDELLLVMEYVQGESLSRLLAAHRHASERIPWRIVAAIMNGILSGLHAAHEAKNERGEPLGIVHRDMSPQNVMVGADGVVRVFDFGIAKAAGRAQDTRAGLFKGKIAYAAPEQLQGKPMDRRVDVYASSVVLWEMIAGRRMFKADDELQLFAMVREGRIEPLGNIVPDMPAGLEAIVMRGLANDPELRFASAREMSIALEEVMPHASNREVAEWVGRVARQVLESRAKMIEEIELTNPLIPTEAGIRDLIPTVVRPMPGESSPPRSGASDPGRPTVPASPYAAASASGTPAPPPVSATVSGPVSAEARKNHAFALLLVLLVVGSGLAGGAFAYLRAGSSTPTVIEEPQTGGQAAPSSSKPKPKEDAPKEQAAKDEPVASATPSVAIAPTTKPLAPKPVPTAAFPSPSSPAASATAAPTASATAAAPAASVTKPTAAPAANCSPPFTIDQDGIRHPKPECM
jgi:serine/threonine protein kinase